MMTICYPVGTGLYVNLTNRCPCSCTFCIRNNGDGAYGSDSLWLEREPSAEEVISALRARKLSDFKEIVFCGYGEPTEALPVLLEVCRYIKDNASLPVRLNTNGLSDLIWGENTAPMLSGLVDTVSVSLNASSAEGYCQVTRPSFGEKAFGAMLKFSEECKNYVPRVMFTVVDVISEEEIEKCQSLADEMGIPLRVRKYEG